MIQSTSHVAAGQCINLCRHKSYSFHKNEIKCDLSDFNCGMVVGLFWDVHALKSLAKKLLNIKKTLTDQKSLGILMAGSEFGINGMNS